MFPVQFIQSSIWETCFAKSLAVVSSTSFGDEMQHLVCLQISPWPPPGVSHSEEEEEWRLEVWRESFASFIFIHYIQMTTRSWREIQFASCLYHFFNIAAFADLSQVLQSSSPSGGAHDLTFTGQTLQVCLLWRVLQVTICPVEAPRKVPFG